MGQEEIKIRVVPRSTEKPKKAADSGEAADGAWTWLQWVYMACGVAVLLVVSVFLIPKAKVFHFSNKAKISGEKRSVSAIDPEGQVETRIGESISRHMTDAKIRQELMMRRQELDNARLRETLDQDTGSTLADSQAEVGPLMDHDKSAERVFEDLDLNSRTFTAVSPHDKINARLASRKWLNEVERAERINFVRNFVRSAYDRGYEVQLNENLVVVGVRRIQKDRKVTIDQIMDRMAKQGF